MIGFLEWINHKELLTESLVFETIEISAVKHQINGMFDDAIQALLKSGKIHHPEHREQARKILDDGYDWWSYLLQVMRQYPYKGQDLYDAATHLAGDLWESVFDPRKYEDRFSPLIVFHRMATIRGQDVAFRFFGWRRKMKATNMTDMSGGDGPAAIDRNALFDDFEWKDLQQKTIQSIEKEAAKEKNVDRGRRAIDVAWVKLTGRSKLYNKQVQETGLDSLAAFYHVNRREMYDTLLIVYRGIREGAKGGNDELLSKVMGELPSSLRKDPEEVILSLIPPSPQEISHSDLFTKAYSSNRELKSLTFKQVIQKLLDKNRIGTRKDNRTGKHQTLYRLVS
jgi:hypothetical protein